MCQWIKQPLSRLREDIIVKTFKKSDISNALDGSEQLVLVHEKYSDEEEEEEESFNDDDDDGNAFQGF